MTHPLRATTLSLTLLLASAFCVCAPAAASTPHKIKTSKAKNQSTKVKFDKGSAETTAERNRRLQRECKGRPNAGACLGYGS
jgi:hypothetical protein